MRTFLFAQLADRFIAQSTPRPTLDSQRRWVMGYQSSAAAGARPQPMSNAETTRLMLDAREVRDRTRLRLIASLPAFVGGVWLCWATDSWLLRAFALASVVFGSAWWIVARKSARQLERAHDHYLDIGESALQVCSGVKRRTLPWTDIEAVEIDEDRLMVVLHLRGADKLALEPHYGALSLSALAELLERCRIEAAASSVGAGATLGMRSPQS